MDGTSSGGREVLRVLVDAPWLMGTDTECELQGRAVVLRDTRAGAEVRLTRPCEVRRAGRVLYVRSRAVPPQGGCIEFAGLGRDARFTVTFPDEATAETVAACLDGEGWTPALPPNTGARTRATGFVAALLRLTPGV